MSKSSKPKLKPKAKTAAVKPADHLGKSIMESAQQIWLAGLGAFSKAQEEGTKLFETLVKEGLSLEQKTRKLAMGKADDMRGAVETGVTQVRERTQETWDKLEKVFEDRVSKALGTLGVPGRRELDQLAAKVEELSREIRRVGPKGGVVPVKPAVKTAARRTRDELADIARELEEAQLANKASTVAKRPARKR